MSRSCWSSACWRRGGCISNGRRGNEEERETYSKANLGRLLLSRRSSSSSSSSSATEHLLKLVELRQCLHRVHPSRSSSSSPKPSERVRRRGRSGSTSSSDSSLTRSGRRCPRVEEGRVCAAHRCLSTTLLLLSRSPTERTRRRERSARSTGSTTHHTRHLLHELRVGEHAAEVLGLQEEGSQ